ncbi:phage holin family protein [Candidatus Peregrinibacteria bacterium]|nr:phage holin family protein [Candidatus Peregrinibacteria bacterium]
MGFLLKPIIGIIVNGGILYAMVTLVEGISYTGGIMFFLIGGLIMGLFNFLIRPLMKIISLPFVILTGGLFLIVVNVGVLWFLSYALDIIAFQDVSLAFQNVGSYVIGAVVFGLINWGVHLVLK